MPFMTVTGVDERCDLFDINLLAATGVEVAFLYTASPDGRNRYPSMKFIADMATELMAKDRKVAIHICGRRARSKLLAFELEPMLKQCDRFQVNGKVGHDELAEICESHRGHQVITQYTGEACLDGMPYLPNHAMLVDGSGGRGILPEKWERPFAPYEVGFAGGLGRFNLSTQLPRIAAAAGDHPWWIDMESSLRRHNGDWFDVKEALECVRIWQSFFGVNP